MKEFNTTLKEAADKTLKKIYRRKILNNNDKEVQEPPWINEDIKNGIKERRIYNRAKRNAKNDEMKKVYQERYEEEKRKTEKNS